MNRFGRLFVVGASLAVLAAVGPDSSAQAAETCEEPELYDACMTGVRSAYNYCLEQHPGDPEFECFGQRATGEATCWAEYCFVFPEG